MKIIIIIIKGGRGELLDIENRISKNFFAYYSCNTTCTLYAVNTEKQPRYATSPGIYKVADFTIPMSTLTGIVRNENVNSQSKCILVRWS